MYKNEINKYDIITSLSNINYFITNESFNMNEIVKNLKEKIIEFLKKIYEKINFFINSHSDIYINKNIYDILKSNETKWISEFKKINKEIDDYLIILERNNDSIKVTLSNETRKRIILSIERINEEVDDMKTKVENILLENKNIYVKVDNSVIENLKDFTKTIETSLLKVLSVLERERDISGKEKIYSELISRLINISTNIINSSFQIINKSMKNNK
jgi:hypothetical protein